MTAVEHASEFGRRCVVALAWVGAFAGCSGSETSTQPALSYVELMTAICDTTTERLAELPVPPEQISADDWATEVARAFRAEATAADELFVGDDAVRVTHRTYVTTTENLAASWALLSNALEIEPDSIGDINVEITELSLGRDDVASELGVDACVRSGR